MPYMLREHRSDGHITYEDAVYSDWVRGLGGSFMWSLDADRDAHSQTC